MPKSERTTLYLANTIVQAPVEEFSSTITFADGHVMKIGDEGHSDAVSSSTFVAREQSRTWAFFSAFVWFMPPAFHSQVKLASGDEALLIDTGAIGNLTGSYWADRNIKEAEKAGQGSLWKKLERSLGIEGVGTGESEAKDEVTIPICFPDGRVGTFRTPVIQNSPLPALWGLESLDSLGAVIDTRNNQFIVPGPNGYKIVLSPGSTVYKTLRAKTGHMMLPCQLWKQAKPGLKPILSM